MTTTRLMRIPLKDEATENKWRPLLDGNARQAAMTTVRQIAKDLPGVLPLVGADVETQSAMLSCWKAESAIFYAYLAAADDDSENAELAYEYLNEGIGIAATQPPAGGLLSGIIELGWVIAHLRGILLDEEEAESGAAVDEFLNELLARPHWPGSYDLISGLAGFGIYALERAPHGSAIEIARKVVTHLWQTAEHNEQGITWHTYPVPLPPSQSQLFPHGHYNLGVAHGVPGVIAVLAQACSIDEVAESALTLLDGAVRWLLANRSYDEQGAYLTYWIAPDVEPELARQAWCYGELGAATALLLAARCVDNRDWEEAALAMLRRSALRCLADSGVQDAGLCHGTAGNAHLFNRIYQATGEALFKQAALYWYEQTFAFITPGEGIAGFRAWGTAEKQPGWITCVGLLEGVAGIGLALLAAATDIEPRWDRLLLASIPPRHHQINV